LVPYKKKVGFGFAEMQKKGRTGFTEIKKKEFGFVGLLWKVFSCWALGDCLLGLSSV